MFLYPNKVIIHHRMICFNVVTPRLIYHPFPKYERKPLYTKVCEKMHECLL